MCCLALSAWAQAQPAALYFDHLTISDGLSHNTVHCLLQDRYGYVWIGTQHGLNRYDGYAFEVFRSVAAPARGKGFVGKKITALHEDRQGNLWVGTGKHGLNLRSAHQDGFENLRSDSAFTAIEGYEISSIYEAPDGYLWIATVEAGLLRYDPAADTARHFTQANSGLSSDVVFDVVQDPAGTLWVATAGGGLNVLQDNQRFALSHPMLPDQPNMSGYHKRFLLDGDHLWVATEGTGLYRMNWRDRSYEHFAPGQGARSLSSYSVRDMFRAEDGRLFIATDGGGLNVYDPRTGKITVHRYQPKSKHGLNSDALICLQGDRTGNLWIGSFNGGVNVYKPGRVWFRRYAPELVDSEELYNRSILSLCQTSDGKVWVGSDGGGLNWISADHPKFEAPPYLPDPSQRGSISGSVVKALYEDPQQRLWVGFFGAGMARYDAATNTFIRALDAPVNVWSMAARQDGDLWIATMGQGLIALDPETLAPTYYGHDPADPGSLVDLNLMVVMVDRDDRVWAGSAYQGLERWDEAQQAFEHYRHDPDDPQSLSNDEVRAIYQDRQGRIWVGTEGGGLNRWLGEGKFTRIGQAEGLIANSVMGITEDEAGRLWITTFDGISRLDPATGDIQNFDFRTAQNANQFNQAAILAADNGQLFFGGTNGLSTLDPRGLEQPEEEIAVILTDFKLFNQSIPAGPLPSGRTILSRPIEEAERIALTYADKAISFAFAAMDYTHPRDYQYRYRLRGFDDQWQQTAPGQNRVSYTNLDPGRYTFDVQYQEATASVALFIEPPFWQTYWFRISLALLLLGLAWGIGHVVMQRKEAAHKRQLLQVQNEKLAAEVEAKTSKLMYSAVQIAHKNEILTDLKNDLLQAQKHVEKGIKPLLRKVDGELRKEDHWKEFDIYFNQVDQNFFQSLLNQHPELTKNDLRMCSLIRINLSTKEIAFLLNISNRAVEQGRYRLKKRLGLGKEEDLNRYISRFQA